ncbi:sulfate transporter [Mycobacterium antarcticum]|uniref:STAS domain-containing protein n=1 Tax=unclassified Mycolicibacterium TaxID=2636767 RepID=UPI00238E867D|nr:MULTISPECIES: STAS domain-containing protein [unclassified Mycolicibacterium]BDX30548.1 sulfate transporter [Mycolicibacterium sp. TUM20985]GLP79672.1 sulfate transporter [Mycolicibacterium sp. TUM20984]
MSLAPGTYPGKPTQPRDRVGFATSSIRSSIVLITVNGEVDAANALELGKYAEARLDTVSRLIVDVRGLTFFGTQGFSILHRINVMCSRHAVNWVLLPGGEVDRVLHICDPDGGLPVAHTLESAITAVVRPPRSHLRLVSNR